MEKVTREQAISEIQHLIYDQNLEKVDVATVEKDYPQLIRAIVDGKMVLGDKPSFELYKPILDDEGSVVKSTVEFKTRIKALDMANITKGIDMSKETYLAVVLMNCHLTGMAKGIYNNLSKIDEKVIQQLCGIFL